MSNIPSSAMPHAKASETDESQQEQGGGPTISERAGKLAEQAGDYARENPKTAIAAGAALAAGRDRRRRHPAGPRPLGLGRGEEERRRQEAEEDHQRQERAEGRRLEGWARRAATEGCAKPRPIAASSSSSRGSGRPARAITAATG